MARPFAHTFEKDQSPLSPQSTSPSTPISYKTNVNRQKTKKWAEAKPIDYGGDDWGEDDEYEAAPLPSSKPTGFRHAGQGIPDTSRADSSVNDVSKKAYGDLPPLPGASHNVRPRANSFDLEDEQRNFSNSSMRQSSHPTFEAPPTRFSQITNEPARRALSEQPPLSISTDPSATGVHNATLLVSPPSDTASPHPDILLPGRKASGDGVSIVVSPLSEIRSPTGNYQARRDFSPSAVPQPLATRSSAAPQQIGVDSHDAVFPARKSSLSQSIGPDDVDIAPEMATSKPWAGGRSSSPGAASRAPLSATSLPKVLPFIRPADIYRRMEEEREKERQSMESGRPSMESINPASIGERSGSPAKLMNRENPDVATGGRHRSSFEGDDASESGRRLMPMLEPVKERKSEYGFDGFNVDDSALPGKFEDESNNTVQDLRQSNRSHLEAEEARRHSVSPKLPDLYRMSGFGLDMFSPTKTEGSTSSAQPETEKTSMNAAMLTSTQNDPTLRKEPSLGFTSVVHQAFDRPSDSSVPATPASNSGSGIKRSDSESTGTAGISPIMSRVPSSAVADGRNRETSTPAILEAVDEPESPSPVENKGKGLQEVTSRHAVPVSLSFKPGHRRDISTPSPGNSPARSPDVGKTTESPSAEMATIRSAASLDNDEPLQPPRPIAEREHSFRPNLPGGWTSYSTTARSTTPLAETAQASSDQNRSIMTTMPPPPRPWNTSDRELTPTTVEHPSPHSGRDVAAITALGGVAGFALAQHEHDNDTSDSDFASPRAIPSNSALPTPDPAMAPSGNVYSTTQLDPRLTNLPLLERAPAESQLRPDVVNGDISANSSVAPTPPPKDTPRAASESSTEYFPRPTVPLKPKSPDQVHGEEYVQPISRPPMLPTLSTDTKPYDEENDKLRKEIVKSLSPRPSDASPAEHIRDPSDAENGAPSRESTYLPNEYDDYWASTADEEHAAKRMSQQSNSEVPELAAATLAASFGLAAAKLPTHPDGTSQGAAHSREAARPMLPTRFSWEASSFVEGEPSFDLAPGFPVPESHQAFSHSATANIEPSKDTSPTLPVLKSHQAFSHSSTANIEPSIDNEPSFPVPDSEQAFSHSSTANIEPSRGNVILSEPVMAREGTDVPNSSIERMHGEPDTSKEDYTARDAALGTGAAIVAAAAYAAPSHQTQSHEAPQRRLSLAEEKAGGPSVSSYPVSPTPPEDEHPARSPQAYFSGSADHPSQSPVSPVSNAMKLPTSPNARIPSFKEILTLRTPQERIRAFNETRDRFATMDSGLGEWIVRLQAEHEEHADPGGSWIGPRTSLPNTSARSKFSKGTGFGSQQSQPYFQQYLNASSPGGLNSPSGTQAGSSSTPSGTQQGLSPASGKITTQQVQAKGKEFLHTAGVFGGKAGKAGKGLLAKGKNKLRGSGAGDKTPTSTTPQTTPNSKSERRSSWGFPLSMSRSSGRPDASSHITSKEGTLVPGHQRSATFTSSTGSPKASVHRPAASTSFIGLGLLGGDAALSAAQTRETLPLPQTDASSSVYTPAHTLTTQTPSPIEEAGNALDTLARPMPISKNQPSWDPFNATPIFEEEAFQYEERNPQRLNGGDKKQGHAGDEGLLDVPSTDLMRSARSSEETPFYDASEDPLDFVGSDIGREGEGENDGWFMVEPQQPSEVIANEETAEAEAVAAGRPAVPSKEVPAHEEPAKKKLPSILDRPRGSLEVPGLMSMNRPRTSLSLPRAPTQQSAAESRGNARSSSTQGPSGQQAPEVSADKPLLPPVRRCTTFGVPFTLGDSDQSPLHNVNEVPTLPSRIEKPLPQPAENFNEQTMRNREAEAAAGIVDHGRSKEDTLPRIPAAEPREDPEPQQYRSQAHYAGQLRPPLVQNISSGYNQAGQQGMLLSQQGAGFNTPRASDINPPNGFGRSQDAWRPNAVPASAYMTSNKWGDDYVNVPRYSFENSRRPSLEQSRPRGHSASSSTGQRLSGYIPRPDVPPQAKSFEQPPSSAQRYPGLFQSVPAPDMPQESDDLPDHYYQAPLAREDVFLPRQQTNEYQLPGVGPPADEPRSAGGKRNSGFFRELGGRISRGASRERNSISGDGELQSPTGRLDSRGYPESSVTSDDMQDRGKRRSSLFGALSRTSTSGAGPPQSRESTIVHHAGSRTDLLLGGQPSPVKKEDKKRSLFGSSSGKPNKLSRASTSNLDDGGKKRFSGLSGFFGKAGQRKSRDSLPEQRPQATRAISHNERQPLESPQFEDRQPINPETRQYHPVPDQQPLRGTSQPRNVLTKLTTNLNSNGSPRRESRSRRPSASGLLSGIIGRRSQNQHHDREESLSRSSGTQQPVHQVPPAQTYTDLQEQQARESGSQNNIGAIPWQEAENQPPERGRRVSRPLPQEPQYDSVPIPGGYSLVRGQGAMAVPTDYDPRGISHLASSPQPYPYPNSANGYKPPHSQQYPARTNTHPLQKDTISLIPVGALDTQEAYRLPAVPRNLEYDEDAGRSPDSQQRPYQLSLPGEESSDHEEREPPLRASIQPILQVRGPQREAQQGPHHPIIHRLQTQNQTPLPHHPKSHLPSPSSYPLPPSAVNSPLPESPSPSSFSAFATKLQAIPPAPFPPSPSDTTGPVPPPKSPIRLRTAQSQIKNLDIQRYLTHRTTFGDVSQTSTEIVHPNAPLQAPPHPVIVSSREIDPSHTEGSTISSAPSTPPRVPPSALSLIPNNGTASKSVARAPSLPLRALNQQNSSGNLAIKETLVERGPSPDLYDATPKVVKKFEDGAHGKRLSPASGSRNGKTSPGRSPLRGGEGLDEGDDEGGRGFEAAKVVRGHREINDAHAEMSATSYPGQEWNPYAVGHGSEDWEE